MTFEVWELWGGRVLLGQAHYVPCYQGVPNWAQMQIRVDLPALRQSLRRDSWLLVGTVSVHGRRKAWTCV